MITLLAYSCGTGQGFMTLIQTQQVLHFFMGLNDVYKNELGSILTMDPLPGLNQVYRLILQKEKQRECHEYVGMNSDSVAMISSYQKGQSYNGGYGNQSRFPNN